MIIVSCRISTMPLLRLFVRRMLKMSRWPKCFIFIRFFESFLRAILVNISPILLYIIKRFSQHASTNTCRLSIICIWSWVTWIHSNSWSLRVHSLSLTMQIAFASIGACALAHAQCSFASKIFFTFFNFLNKVLRILHLFRMTPSVWSQVVGRRV